MFQDWLTIYKKTRDSTILKSDCICPECGANSIDLQFVGDIRERIGYLDMWCTTCLRGVHISRVLIPEGEPMISFDDPISTMTDRIPDFKQITP